MASIRSRESWVFCLVHLGAAVSLLADPPRPGDLDTDGDVDLVDFTRFEGCMGGPGYAPAAPCASADLDADGDVDLRDFVLFQAQFTGPDKLVSLKAAPDSIQVVQGDKAQISVTGEFLTTGERNLSGSAAGTSYASDDPQTLLVSSEGVILALNVGEAVVTARHGVGPEMLRAEVTVQVSAPSRPMSVNPGQIVGEVLDADNDLPLAGAAVSAPGVSQTVHTDAAGRFALPVSGPGKYLVKIEKPGYTFVQRHAEVPLGQDTVVERAFLTPVDVKSTPVIAAAGGTASDSSGQVEVVIPAGALPEDADIRITPVRELDHLVGIQPDYGLFAFGAQLEPSPMTFSKPVGIRVRHNLIGVRPGDRFPLTKWDEAAGQWIDIGQLVVSPDTHWLEGTLTTFSYVHCNCSHPPPWQTPNSGADCSFDDDPVGDSCPIGVQNSFVEADTGCLREDHQLPAIQSLGRDQSLSLVYHSGTVSPQIRVAVSNDWSNIFVKPDLAEWRFSVAGATRRVSYGGYTHASRQAYVWDGRTDAGRPAPTGSYACRLTLVDRFNGGTYQWVCGTIQIGAMLSFMDPIPVEIPHTFNGRLSVENLVDSEFGAGWKLGGMPRLHFGEDGVVLLTGPGGPRHFTPGTSGVYVNAPGETSELRALPDGTFQRTLKDQTAYLFAADGRCLRRLDRNGNATRYEYDAAGLLTRVVDPGGRVTLLAYDASGRIASIADPAGRITRFEVDAGNNLRQITNPDGTGVRFAYDGAHRLTEKTDPRDQVSRYVYDDLGRIMKTIAPNGREYSFIPKDRLALVNPVLAAGGGTRENPAVAINTQMVDPQNQDEMFGYTDERGTTTLHRVDRRGGLVEMTKANGGTLLTRTTIQRDAEGYPIKATRPNGASTTTVYGPKRNVQFVRDDSIDATTSYTYDERFNQITSITDALGRTTRFDLDDRGNVIRATDPLGNVTGLAYDARGLLASTTDAEGATTTIERDGFGNVSRLVDPLGNETRIEYDPAGNVVASTDPNGRRSEYTFDLMNRLLSQRSCCGGAAEFTYDPAGNLLTVTDANEHATQFAYDITGRLASMTDPLGTSEVYAYNLADDLTATNLRSGTTREYGYDALGRLVSKAAPGESERFAYDVSGNMLTAWDDKQALWQGFDPVGRLTSSFGTLYDGPIATDRDGDCLPDDVERRLGLNPESPDSDGDGISDGAEDPDGDSLVNCAEVVLGTDLTNPDTDGDLLKDGGEGASGTDPLKPDTDGDGFWDGDELEGASNPLDPSSIPVDRIGRSFTVRNVAVIAAPVQHDFTLLNEAGLPKPLPPQLDFTILNQNGMGQPLPVLQDFTVRNQAP